MFPHKDNLKCKIRNNYKSQKQFFESFDIDYYIPWHENNLSINNISHKDISKKVSLFEEYLTEVEKANNTKRPVNMPPKWITPQSKFRPTVLEEFCYYLLKDVPEIKKLSLEFKKKRVHAGFEIDSKGKIRQKRKDVDCAIVKAEEWTIGGKKLDLSLPVICIECKTYLDGTMWNEAQYSALLLKKVNSSAKIYVLAEENQVDLSKITKESPVDDVFVLRNKETNKIAIDVVSEFVGEIQKNLQTVMSSNPIRIPGRLINY